jgi:transcriptional regulator with XRE-family HTH domain
MPNPDIDMNAALLALGDRIALDRKRRKMSQTALAKRLRVSQGHVSAIENAKTIDWETIERACKILEIDFQQLVETGSGYTTPAEAAISADEGLTAGDRRLLLMIYAEMRLRGPFGT